MTNRLVDEAPYHPGYEDAGFKPAQALTTIDLIRQWARDRNLIEGSDSKSQLLKTMSELGELADGINKQRIEECKDGIGDVVVTLVIVAAQLGLSFEECVDHAYNEIKDRKGRMVDGVFIKEGDVAK